MKGVSDLTSYLTSDNIYMKYDTRLAVDTLYFGLQIDDLGFKWFMEEIKNYLFFELKENLKKSRSKYYECELVNEDFGFYCFFSPHKNLLNDYATIQLTGKFFRNMEHEKAIEKIIEIMSGYIRYQRIDVCLDVLWIDLPFIKDDLTKNIGFPVPSYSERWKNKKLAFNIFGRWDHENYFVNMISCGKGDLLLRVYDKELDLEEKYGMNYSEYYGLDLIYKKIFRIEYQMRGKSLKEFLVNCNDLGISFLELEQLKSAIISCVFNKYEFLYLECENPIYIKTSIKRKSTLDNQIEFHKNKSGFHFFRYRDLVDEKDKIDSDNKYIEKINLEIAKKQAEELHTIFEFDLDKLARNIYQDNVKDIPF